MTTKPFNTQAALDYARRWALARNPAYADYETLGGDCTAFMSQILIAGGAPMNHTPHTGWYYRSLNQHSPSWTGVPYMFHFLTQGTGTGPFGCQIPLDDVQPGDIIQLKFAHKPKFSHSLFVLSVGSPATPENTLIAAHSYDALDRPLSTYEYEAARALRIEGVRA
ncbi:MAG: amidase domain-containing protein [Oscillospiraceae bacterium]|nr:amidase domain-containing protein [Oscillospiraceae bacterium]